MRLYCLPLFIPCPLAVCPAASWPCYFAFPAVMAYIPSRNVSLLRFFLSHNDFAELLVYLFAYLAALSLIHYGFRFCVFTDSVCMCVSLCVYFCVDVCISVCMCVSLYICVYLCVWYLCVCVSLCVRVNLCVCASYAFASCSLFISFVLF